MVQISLRHLSSLRYLRTAPIEDGEPVPRIHLSITIDKEDPWIVESNKNGTIQLRHAKHKVYFGAQAMCSSTSPIDPCTKYIPYVTSKPDPDRTEWILQLHLGTDRLRLVHCKSNLYLRAHRYEYDGQWRLELVEDSTDPETEWVRSTMDEPAFESEPSYQSSVAAWVVLFLFISFGAYLHHLETF